jgi:hypothetical protein
MNAMPSSKSWIPRLLAFVLAAAPALAHAQSLPKGYASDELPAATTAATPAAAPVMKPTSSDSANVEATAQISTSTDEFSDTDPSALTDFQEPLQPYGTWVVDGTYGTVWVPDTTVVGSDFAPYQSGGYWSLTDDGEWLWVSSYDWGYVTFHYGRWVWISGRGWSWIPGRTYAPSWVVWRTSDYGYIGWAPMPPTYYWSSGAVVYVTTVPSAAYVFCPTTHVFHTSVHSYIVHDKDTVTKIAAHSRNYKPASPTASSTSPDKKAPDSAKSSNGSSSSAASATAKAGAAGGVSAVRKPVGPSAKEAGIPDSAMPKSRAAHDSRAKMFSKKSTTAKAKALVKSQRAALLGSAGTAPVSRAGAGARGSSAATVAASGRNNATSAAQASARQAVPRGQSPVIRTPSSRAAGGGSAPQPAVRASHRGSSQSSQVAPARASSPAPAARSTSVSAAVSKPVARPAAPVAAPRAAVVTRPAPAPAAAPRASGGGGRRH